jgi:serine/threonine-protein kinase
VAAAILQVAYLIRGVDLGYHLKIMTLIAVWAVVSVGFACALGGRRTAELARFGWVAADVLLLTTLLFMADPPSGTLLIGYPLLIAAAGLFFRVRLVWFMTGVTLASYGTLAVLRPEMHGPPQYPLIYAAVLVVLGIIVTYQVHRVRALSRYYEARRLP